MLPLFVFTLLVQFLAEGCAKPYLEPAEVSDEETSRIHAGTLASYSEFKSTVRVIVEEKFTDEGALKTYEIRGDCTGTIISRKWVLTASHILPCNFQYSRFHDYYRFFIDVQEKLVVHHHCYGHDCSFFEVNQYFAHPRAIEYFIWCNNTGNVYYMDVALLELKNELTFGDRFESMPLMSGDMQCAMTDCIALGFGDQWANPPEGKFNTYDRLYYIYVNAGNLDYCRYALNTTKNPIPLVKNNFICATNLRNPLANTCVGDSGSGLLCPDRFGDLVSVGVLYGSTVSCGNANVTKQYNRYSSVGFVEDWIKITTNDTRIVFKPL